MPKAYLGQVEFKITSSEINAIIRGEVETQLRWERKRLEDEIKAIRNLQKRMCKVEMKLDTTELKKKK
jgi:hypothetical protein